LDILESFINAAPFISELVTVDIAIAVTDREKYLSYCAGDELDHGVEAEQVQEIADNQAAVMEETAASSDELNEVARKLEDLAGNFNKGEE